MTNPRSKIQSMNGTAASRGRNAMGSFQFAICNLKFPFLLTLLACLGTATVALAQSTVFTYQGRLGADGTAANA